jgi:ferrochelatase
MAEIVFFALSPFYTTRTTGVYIKAAEDSLAGLSCPYSPATTFVHSWYAEPPFIGWWVKEVRKAVEQFHDAFFLFSAHSMPATGEDDLYRSQVEEAVRLIANQADLSSYALAWQSTPQRAVEEWMAPSVEQTLRSLADQGKDSVIQIPVGFLVDNLETLYDIDMVHKRYAEGLGLRFYRLPCPNTDPLFVQVLSNILSYYLKVFR